MRRCPPRNARGPPVPEAASPAASPRSAHSADPAAARGAVPGDHAGCSRAGRGAANGLAAPSAPSVPGRAVTAGAGGLVRRRGSCLPRSEGREGEGRKGRDGKGVAAPGTAWLPR